MFSWSQSLPFICCPHPPIRSQLPSTHPSLHFSHPLSPFGSHLSHWFRPFSLHGLNIKLNSTFSVLLPKSPSVASLNTTSSLLLTRKVNMSFETSLCSLIFFRPLICSPVTTVSSVVPAVLSSAVLRLLTRAKPPPFPLNQRKLVQPLIAECGSTLRKRGSAIPTAASSCHHFHPVLCVQTVIAPLLTAQLPRWLSGKESTCQCRRHGFNSWARKIPWRKKWQPTPVVLPGKSHGHRSLVGCSPGGCKRVRQDLKTQHNNNSKSRLWETLDG